MTSEQLAKRALQINAKVRKAPPKKQLKVLKEEIAKLPEDIRPAVETLVLAGVDAVTHGAPAAAEGIGAWFQKNIVGTAAAVIVTAIVTIAMIEPAKAQWFRFIGQMSVSKVVGIPEKCTHISGVPRAAFDQMSPKSNASYSVYDWPGIEPVWALCTVVGDTCLTPGTVGAGHSYCIVFDSSTCKYDRTVPYATPQDIPGLAPLKCR